MSDPKRATLITVGAPKSAKNNVKKTVRLTINLDESNESNYPELNYKELVIAEERKKKVENGKTSGLDPFSDNDDDVERVARKFEQKYGGKSTYGRKGRSKMDDFADIGAGYDESDSFIDNTHGYDEMIPPECDTLYGGFYINCGSLEFKNVQENQNNASDGEHQGNRRNKRRISSSSSEEESSESSSESESQDEKDPKAITNGAIDSHKTEHRKKKNKKVDSKIPKKVRRNDSSAATSGKQTSDDNGICDGESADSRTSQSDSLTSKPAPSSENAITSDSSRDAEVKTDVDYPPQVRQVLEALETAARKHLAENPNVLPKELFSKTEQSIIRVERTLSKFDSQSALCRNAWNRAATALSTTRTKLIQRIKSRADQNDNRHAEVDVDAATPVPPMTNVTASSLTTTVTTVASTTTTTTTVVASQKRKSDDDPDEDFSRLTDEDREAKIVETLQRLKALIEDRKPGMIANYNAECERVQEERKKQQQSAAEGAPVVEKRLPKRRFPWCGRARALLSRLRRLSKNNEAAAALLANRVLPLFPAGFVRMPTLLRQADLSKEIKMSEIKRQRINSTSQQNFIQTTPAFTEPIQFPSSLTVTTSTKSDRTDNQLNTDEKYKSNSLFNSMLNSLNMNKDLLVEKTVKNDTEKKDSHYIPPNNIGNITITAVSNRLDKSDKGLIRVKSPAALNEMVKKDKSKKDKNHLKEKSADTPLHVETNYPVKDKKSEVIQKQIESMRHSEDKIPRPALVPVQHSPTFAKPDKRPPEVKKKDILIISDVDPLSDGANEPVAIDDSSSDVEVIEDKSAKTNLTDAKTHRTEVKRNVKTDRIDVRTDSRNDVKTNVPSKDNRNVQKKPDVKSNRAIKEVDSKIDHEEASDYDFDAVMKNLREMENSQDPTIKMSNNSFSGVISNVQNQLL